MNYEWKPHKLGELISLEYGKPLPRTERNPNGRYPVYGANGVKAHSDIWYCDQPSIIVGRKGSAGECNLTLPRYWPLDVTYYVEFDRLKYDLRFLFHLLEFQDLPKLAKGVKPGINRNDVYSLSVLVPPLPEQKRIVAILDEAFGAIDKAKENAEKNLANARELFNSYLNRVFAEKGEGWERFLLSDVTTKIGSGATPKGGKKAYKTDGTSLIRSLNVHDRSFKWKDLAFIDDKQSERLSNVVLESGDVLLNITGASVARCCIVPDSALPSRVNQHVSILRTNPRAITPKFLCYLLTSKEYKDRLLAVGEKGGATRQAITKAQLLDFAVVFPSSIEVQNTMSAKLHALNEQAEKLETVYRQVLNSLAELKQSLLHKAFTGQLTNKLAVTVASSDKVTLSTSVAGISTTDLHAGILALAYQSHQGLTGNRKPHFGHVKGEKIAHMVEYLADIDLGRNPVKDAAGPNDFPHLKKVETRAKLAGFFEVMKTEDRYALKQGAKFNALVQKTEAALGNRLDRVQQVIDLMAPMTTRKAEILATTHAAWNNLLLRGEPIDDEAIVTEARENWHESKLKIEREKFFQAIGLIHKEGIEPTGQGKLVDQKPKPKKNRKVKLTGSK